MRRSRVAAITCLALLPIMALACGDDSPDKAGPYAVGTRSVTFVDHTRSTPAIGDQPARPERTVVTEVWYPAAGKPSSPIKAGATPADGPFPLIVFNHGQQGEPEQYALSFEMWARAGFVVAAPRHPVTVLGGPGGHFVDDVAGELGDIPFVIDRIDARIGDADVDHLAVAGHSSGAIASFAVGLDRCCYDHRVDAVLLEGFVGPGSAAEPSKERADTPVMFIHGDLDLYPIEQARQAYDAIGASKFFVSLHGGDHSNAFRVGPIAERASKAALAFFDFALKGRSDAVDALRHIDGIDVTRSEPR